MSVLKKFNSYGFELVAWGKNQHIFEMKGYENKYVIDFKQEYATYDGQYDEIPAPVSVRCYKLKKIDDNYYTNYEIEQFGFLDYGLLKLIMEAIKEIEKYGEIL